MGWQFWYYMKPWIHIFNLSLEYEKHFDGKCITLNDQSNYFIISVIIRFNYGIKFFFEIRKSLSKPWICPERKTTTLSHEVLLFSNTYTTYFTNADVHTSYMQDPFNFVFCPLDFSFGIIKCGNTWQYLLEEYMNKCYRFLQFSQSEL